MGCLREFTQHLVLYAWKANRINSTILNISGLRICKLNLRTIGNYNNNIKNNIKRLSFQSATILKLSWKQERNLVQVTSKKFTVQKLLTFYCCKNTIFTNISATINSTSSIFRHTNVSLILEKTFNCVKVINAKMPVKT